MPPMSGDRSENPAADGRGDTLPHRPQLVSRLDIEESLLPLRTDSTSQSSEKGVAVEPQRHKTVIAFGVILLSGFFNFFLLTIIHDVVPRGPLPDLVFMVIEQQPWAIPVGDVLATISIAVTFTLVFLHRYRWLILRRLFLIAGFIYGLRACVLAVTFLPPSFNNHSAICFPAEEKIKLTGWIEVEMWNILMRFRDYVITLGLTSKQGKILCGDLMFSGHTISLSCFYFIICRYTPRRAWLVRWCMMPIAYFGMASMVLSGGHYTMDVLIAYWLSSHLFWAYHQVFEGPRAGRDKSAVSWLWWYWVSVWFETGSSPEGRLPNDLEWPLPWPALAVRSVAKLSATLNSPEPCLPF